MGLLLQVVGQVVFEEPAGEQGQGAVGVEGDGVGRADFDNGRADGAREVEEEPSEDEDGSLRDWVGTLEDVVRFRGDNEVSVAGVLGS